MALSKSKASEQNQQLKGGLNFYEFGEKNHLRFVPLFRTLGGEEEWCVPYAQHFLRVSEAKTLAIYCAKFGPFFKQECTGCSIYVAAKKFLPKEDLQQIAAKKRGMALAIDIDEPKLGLQRVRVPISIVRLLNQYAKDDYDFADLDEGAGVTITRTGSGKGTEYSLSPYKQGLSLPIDELMDRDDVIAAMEELDPEAFIELDNAEAMAEFARESTLWRPEIKPAVPKALLMGASTPDGDEDSGEGGETLDAEFDELPTCYGKEWEEGDSDCEDCPNEDDCKEAFEKKKAKKKGKPKRKPKPKAKPRRSGKSRLSGLM